MSISSRNKIEGVPCRYPPAEKASFRLQVEHTPRTSGPDEAMSNSCGGPPGSLPTLDLHLTPDNAHLVRRQWRTSRAFSDAAVCEREARRVPGAPDGVAFLLAFFERRAIVRANGADGMDFLAGPQEQDRLPV